MRKQKIVFSFKLIALFIFCCSSSFAFSQKDSLRYIPVEAGYLMVLKPGDDVLEQLKQLTMREHIPSAYFTAIGFASLRLGFYNSKKKKYRPKDFVPGEITNLQGSIAWKNDSVSVHAHGLINNKHFRTFGGHVLSARVGQGTMEILVILNKVYLKRSINPGTGANEICLPCVEN